MDTGICSFGTRTCAPTRWQVSVTQREREELEGKPLDTTFIALLEFPSAEAVRAFATDPKYAPYAAARQAGSDSRFQLIDDTDVAGTIPYLPKG
jgi:uncharacterized protein (DUF1330 family)